MKLLELYSALQAGEITLDQAAAALGTTTRGLKIRITKHEHRLPLVLSVLDKIADGAISRDQAAEILEVTVRSINKLMQVWLIQRPITAWTVNQAAIEVKWEVRKKFACDFIAGRTSLESASAAAGVSTRQMRRWVAELIKKHFGMVYRDLATLDINNLRRISEHIRQEEALEEAKVKAAEQIGMGMTTVADLAIGRASAKRTRKLLRKA